MQAVKNVEVAPASTQSYKHDENVLNSDLGSITCFGRHT